MEGYSPSRVEQAGQRCGARLRTTHPGVGPVTAVACDPRKNALLKVGNRNDRMDARKLSELLYLNKLSRRATANRVSAL